MTERKQYQTRSIGSLELEPSTDQMPTIRGYFIVFNTETELYPGCYEEISDTALNGVDLTDVRALVNHDTTKVLGRTKNETLKLSVDNKGLYGEITINENDQEAMNLYQRVYRGDVDQCSFGFTVTDEDMVRNSDGSTKFIVKEIELFEVSVTTFPAYEATAVEARSKQIKEVEERCFENKKQQLEEKINGLRTIIAGEKD